MSSAVAMEGNQGNTPSQGPSPSATDGPGGHRDNWLDSLARWAKDLAGNPSLMDHFGRMPGEPGYRSPGDYPGSGHRSDKNAGNNQPSRHW